MLSLNRFWSLFGMLSLAAVATGCWVASAYGVSERIWSINLAAWAVGLGLAFALSRARFERWWPWLTLAGLVLTFVSPGMQGIHRWIGIGPFSLNVAALLLPALVVALPFDGSRLKLAFAVLIPLALQPDASQAIAFAGGAIAVVIVTAVPNRIFVVAFLAALAALSVIRSDPLAPVPTVEGIVDLAYALSPAIAGLAVLTLAGASLAPLTVARSPAAWGLAAYLVLSALAPAFGAFPVPLVGMGISPILGLWLGFGALMGVTRRAL